jgi:hypothetical protein
MEKREFERKNIGIEATVMLNGNAYQGYIEDASTNGLHVIAVTGTTIEQFVPEAKIELRLSNSPDGDVRLKAEIRWVHLNKTPIHGLSYRMGVNVMPPRSDLQQIIGSPLNNE